MPEFSHTDIRRPAVAGQFYPGDPGELAKTLAGMFAEVEKAPITGRPFALIAPHAGYPYSGRTAAKAYKLLEGEEYDTVVVVAPSHTMFFKGCAVYGGGGYQTPLGVIETDHELAARIASINPVVYLSGLGHAEGATRGEHALEVQLPFLQIALGKFKLVAIVMGDQESNSVNGLAEVLAATLKNTNTLMVASTDLSHFHSEDTARKLDSTIQKAIEKYDTELLARTLDSGKGEACGGGPVLAVMQAAKRLGASEVTFLEYTTSGATTGDFSEVVGYLSAAIVGERRSVAPPAYGARAARSHDQPQLIDEDKKFLLRIAREAIEAHLDDRRYAPVSSEGTDRRAGAFVTINLDGELRGCIGQIKARTPLYQTVAEMAVSAASEDSRFDPLTRDEFERIQIEISVLSTLEIVRKPSDIKIGRDGLMIKLNGHSGLLLPQVATEHGWDVVEFLEQTCLKAGLPKHSHKDRSAEIYKFSAEVFS
jgi:AmmeMemoRadiSam system protein B/AmmeMemoRadiSam system protein A